MFGRWCVDARIAVRTFDRAGVRVSIGSPQDNDSFLTAANQWRVRTTRMSTSDGGNVEHDARMCGLTTRIPETVAPGCQ
jgi:hypothetical protein